ncbi:MAG: ABC transporter ATP-binding protein [Chloroflexota bacterium]|nr:ABC transporter ATP-binding protein [Chloroflexota bacterium]
MNDSNKAFLQVKGLTRMFGGLCAVNGVSFEVTRGEIFGLIGPNGAGKTTLFNLITGLTPVSSGRQYFKGRDMTALKPHQIAALGVARTFQNIRLFGGMSALDNVMVAQHRHMRAGIVRGVIGGGSARAEEQGARNRAFELLELVNLGDRWHQQARNFAYGDQRRLEIARALASQPEILLLDEPGAGMNPNEKAALSGFIRQIRDRFKLTIVLIEHNVPMVMGLCDRIAVLNFGELIALGVPQQVQTDPAVIEAYLGD